MSDAEFSLDRIAIHSEPWNSGIGFRNRWIDPRPGASQHRATIQCNGRGGYEVFLGFWATATCGTRHCVIEHEKSHIKDYKGKWPKGCEGRRQGELIHEQPEPKMPYEEYMAFQKDSECRAHKLHLKCAERLKPSKDCEETVQEHIAHVRAETAEACAEGGDSSPVPG